MRIIILFLSIALLPGCVCNIAWRGVVNNTQQEATTEGTITNEPWHGATTISAEKTTDLKATAPTN